MFCFLFEIYEERRSELKSILYQDVGSQKIVILFRYRYLIEREDRWLFKAES